MERKFSKKFTEEEIKKRTERIKKAREKFAKERSLNTEENDQILLDCLERYQKLTLKQIKDVFSKGEKEEIFQRSFLLNALKRLESKRLIFSRTSKDIIQGKIIKYYFFNFTDNQDETEIIIPKYTKLSSIMNNPTAYAISNDTIIIAKNDVSELKERSAFYENVKLISSKKDLDIIKLPKSFIQFYDLKPGKFYFDKEPSNDKLILTKIRIFKSEPESKEVNSKKILILEDNPAYGSELQNKLVADGHNVILVKNTKEFFEQLKHHGSSFDIISLDKRIGDENVAKRLSIEIRYNAPQAKVGLLTSLLDDDEKKEYQDLGFDFILPKRPKRNKKLQTGFSEIGAELASWIKAV